MNEKRRDKKNRILYRGEFQEKDGSYSYRYTECGKRKKLTSWKLTNADVTPQGKKDKPCLREQIEMLKKKLGVFGTTTMTVCELVDDYLSIVSFKATHNTKAQYRTVQNVLKKDAFGARKIDTIKYSDAKRYLQKLQQEDGKSYSSIHTIRGVLRPAFRMAVEDRRIEYNPFDFELKDVLINDSVKREALSIADERRFLKFIQEDKHYSRYYDGIYILFKTGLRISEFCGLTRADIDFKEHKITINHQLQRTRDGEYIIVQPKTEASNRMLPLKSDVENAFKRIIKARKHLNVEPTVKDEQGNVYFGFLFLDKNCMPLVSNHWEKYFQRIIEKHNKTYKNELPKVTPHVARHTYCTRMATSGISSKTLQYLMGHSDIATTMNIYANFKYDDALSELSKVDDFGVSQTC